MLKQNLQALFLGLSAMACLLHIFFFISLLGLAGAGQESSSIEALNFQDTTIRQLPQTDDHAFAVSVTDEETLAEISSSVLKSETWLRTRVLSRYPSTKITAIVVFVPGFCQTTQQEHNFGLVLSSLKNIYHSLTRWGLQKDIQVSPGFYNQCLEPKSPKQDIFELAEVIKPIFLFLETINSTFTINPPPNFLSSFDNHLGLVRFMKKFGLSSFYKMDFTNPNQEEARTSTIRRKLGSLVDISTKIINSYTARPTPLPEISPIHTSISFSAPATTAKNPKNPFPPVPQPSLSPAAAFPPELPPGVHNPPLSPSGSSHPPCAPPHAAAPPTRFAAAVPAPAKAVEGLWCVAKPSVPEETLQLALDFACGEGGADCDEISPHGNCFYPDTVVNHASYAFNSYWQKTKRHGGSCSFGGTAMLITADPSFLHCRFVLS